MATKKIPKDLEKEISNYIKILKEDKLSIEKIILFGSYARGMQNEWSDVDLCIISSQFNDAWEALNYLSKKTSPNPKYYLEPVGFHPKDLEDPYSPLISEIKKNGIELSVNL